MAALSRCGRALARPLLHQNSSIYGTISKASVSKWNKDWKPGPYPETPAEVAAAAKRYGLRPEDYKPYPDDGFGHGDYPNLPVVPTDFKDSYEVYDTPELKRNYGEPLHVDADAMREDAWNPKMDFKYTFNQMYMWFGTVVGGFLLAFFILEPYPIRPNVMPKQFPGGDKKHYTFEPVD